MVWSNPRTFVTGETVTAAHLNQEIRDNLNAGFPNAVSAVSWSPTLQATTINPAAVTAMGRYWRVGPLVYAAARFVFATDGGSGSFFATLPTAATGIGASTGSGSGQAIGGWSIRDDSALVNNQTGVTSLRSSTTVQFSLAAGTVVNDTTIVWDTNDVLTFYAMYPAA